MRINFNAIQPKNTIINAARVNASFAKNNSRTAKSAGTGRSDRADFSPQGKLMSMIETVSYTHLDVYKRQAFGAVLGTGSDKPFFPPAVYFHHAHAAGAVRSQFVHIAQGG